MVSLSTVAVPATGVPDRKFQRPLEFREQAQPTRGGKEFFFVYIEPCGLEKGDPDSWHPKPSLGRDR